MTSSIMSAWVLDQQTHTTIIRERGVKIHTLAPINGSHRADCGSETLGGSWDKHRLLPLNLGWKSTLARIDDKKPRMSVAPET